MSKKQSASKKYGLSGISVLAVLSVVAAGAVFAPPLLHSMTAQAQTHSTEGEEGHSGGGKGGSAGHDSDSHDESEGHDSGSVIKGKGSKGGNSGAGGGGKGGVGASGTGGTGPVWAKEGIPEVELGRLNVARSPDQVLSRAYAEAMAMATITPEIVAFYRLPQDEMISELLNNWDGVSFYDSPLQNLAMLKETLNGTQVLGGINSADTLMAAFLGTASDKTIPISVNTVIAITTILGTPVSGDAAIKLAKEADAIRAAILAGHG